MTVTVEIIHARLAHNGKPVFNDINLCLPEGRWTALLGASGVGKSSLLRMIAGITADHEDISGNITFTPANHDHLIAYMAQTDMLLPWLNIIDNVLLGLKLRKQECIQRKTDTNNALALLDQVGLGHTAKMFPHQLSGGMRQRVALARTLMQNKPIVLMDEPFSSLDAITRYHLQGLAAELLQNKTVLFVTHDPAEALRLAHHIYIMRGSPASIQEAAILNSTTPREPDDPVITKMYAQILKELTRSDPHESNI